MEAWKRWLEPLPVAEQMRAVDRCAIEQHGVPGIDLMERAGAQVARAVERVARDGRVAVLCGAGNNGGDGLVVARLLRAAGREVTVVCASDPAGLRGDARTNLERLAGEGPLDLDGRPWSGGAAAADPLAGAALLVDALLGTGSTGAPRDAIARAIELARSAALPTIAVDVPSGVDASSGEVAGAAIEAELTVTFHAAKLGLWVNPGKRHAGRTEVVEIGIPSSVPLEFDAGLIERAVAAGLPRRGPASNKFTSGHVLVLGGSREYVGAPRLAGAGAMRAGAGYATICVPAAVQPTIAAAVPELIGRPLAEEDGALAVDAAAEVLALAARADAIVVGPGAGRAATTLALVRTVALESELPLVLDADGLAAFDGRVGELRRRAAPTVLTPHPGELARLLTVPGEDVNRRRLHHVRAAAAEAGAIALLKGDDTLVAHPDGPLAVSAGDSPGLATAGTGDVLAGAIGALIAQGCEPFRAACAGVWLHAEAGRLAARDAGAAEGVVASDVIAHLPRARGEAEAP